MTESEFRKLAKETYDRISQGFEQVDPDVAECEDALGSLTIELADGARWILSLQPPVSQLWLAVASLGRAYHFDYDDASGTWRDDKGQGIELLNHLQDLLHEVAGIEVSF